jgi:hypothetical protein
VLELVILVVAAFLLLVHTLRRVAPTALTALTALTVIVLSVHWVQLV